jgi:hypothetical protein
MGRCWQWDQRVPTRRKINSVTITEKPGGFPRVETHRREMLVRLAANAPRLEIRRDTDVPGGYIVNDPETPDVIERINSRGQCTCQTARISGICVHAATVELHHGRLT